MSSDSCVPRTDWGVEDAMMYEQVSTHRMEGAAPLTAIHTIGVIDARHLVAECLVRCLRAQRPSDHVVSFSNVIDCIAAMQDQNEPTLLLMSIGASGSDDSRTTTSLATLREAFPGTPVIVLADGETAAQILEVLDLGAKGYIPTSVSLEVAVEAMNLVGVGGTFIPASSLTSSRSSIQEKGGTPIFNGAFTARQVAVVEALRKGKANKIIAYELNMRESTVKVHVRNIMKKLKAKNRTEVAFLANSQLDR